MSVGRNEISRWCVGNVLALWLVHWTQGHEVWGLKPVWVIVLCSWAKLYIFTVSVSTQGINGY